MRKAKFIRLTAFTALFSSLLFACGEDLPDLDENAESTEAESEELDVDTSGTDTLVIGMSNAPHSQNPFYAQGTSAVWSMRFFYETLLDQTSTTDFVPRLGEFETDDNETFTVKINPDANWTDGEPVTADDVAFTFNTIAHPDTLTTFATYVSMLEGTDSSGKLEEGEEEISGVKVIDDKTLEFKTKKPVDINYVSEFLGVNILIAPEHVLGDIPKDELHTADEATHPTVFSGAYKFEEYVEENYLYMTANEDYYRGAPKIENIYMRVLSNEAMVTELQAGEIHMVSQGGFGDVPHHDIELVEDTDNLVVEESSNANVQYLLLNNEDPRFEDVRVRQAFAYALDFDMAIENLLLGHGETLAGTYSSASSYKDEDLDPYPYDPEKAKELLEDADFDFDEPIELGVPTGNTIREQNADLVEQWLEAIGLEVTQTQYDFTTWMSYLRDGDYEIGMYGQGHNYDPDVTNVLGTDGTSNHQKYSSSEMDALLKKGAEETEVEDRYEVYKEVQQLVKDDAPLIPLYSESVYSVQVDNLDGGIEPFYPASLIDLQEWELTE